MSSGSSKASSGAPGVAASPSCFKHSNSYRYSHRYPPRSSSSKPLVGMPSGVYEHHHHHHHHYKVNSANRLSGKPVNKAESGLAHTNHRLPNSAAPPSASPPKMESASLSGNSINTSSSQVSQEKSALSAQAPGKPSAVNGSGTSSTSPSEVKPSETDSSLANTFESSLTLSPSNTSKQPSPVGTTGASNTTVTTIVTSAANSFSESSTVGKESNNTAELVNHVESRATTTTNTASDCSKPQSVPKHGTPVPNRVFVGGIPLDASEHDVRQLFAQYGTIHSVKIITDRAGVSKGYGFVTYDREEDAQKVIKEADNLIIKSRKLNVSTAVMKHLQNSYDSRYVHGSSIVYSQMPYGNTSTLSQLYDNFHGVCPAEGLPFYQIAGINGHFVSNCPSVMSPSASSQFMAQTAAAFSSPYQNATNYIYPSGVPQLSAQHSLYHTSGQSPGQHLLSGTSLSSPPHAFQYSSSALNPPSGANSNTSAMSSIRYPLPSANNNTSTQSPQINLNGLSSQQQYSYQFSTTASPGMSHGSMPHLATAMQLSPQTHLASMHPLSSVPELTNPAASTSLASGATNSQLSAALLHHHHHGGTQQSNSIYTTYPSNMAVAHPLTTSAAQMSCMQNMHWKKALWVSENGLAETHNASMNVKGLDSNMELMESVMMNSAAMNATGANSTASALPQLHSGYLPHVMEVLWPSHVPNATAYCSGNSAMQLNTISAPVSNSNYVSSSGYNENNSKGYYSSSIRHTSNANVSNNTGTSYSYSKSPQSSSGIANSTGTQVNSQTQSSCSVSTATNTGGVTTGNSLGGDSMSTSSKERGQPNSCATVSYNNTPSRSIPPEPRNAMKSTSQNSTHCSLSSQYEESVELPRGVNSRKNNPSHKKMYNGNSSCSLSNKTKLVNGHVSGNSTNTRYHNSVDSNTADSSSSDSKQHYSKPQYCGPSSSSVVNSRPSGCTSSTSGNGVNSFRTKTVNGVKIYALVDEPVAMVDGAGVVIPYNA